MNRKLTHKICRFPRAPPLFTMNPPGEISFELRSREGSVRVPYGAVSEVWTDDNGSIHLLLGAALVHVNPIGFTLEPFETLPF